MIKSLNSDSDPETFDTDRRLGDSTVVNREYVYEIRPSMVCSSPTIHMLPTFYRLVQQVLPTGLSKAMPRLCDNACTNPKLFVVRAGHRVPLACLKSVPM